MKFVLRVDDIGWTSEESKDPPLKRPDFGLEIAQRFHKALGGLPYLGAVIPAAVDKQGLEWLKSEPTGLTIALHGWDHRPSLPGARDEFLGLLTASMRDRIAEGQKKIGPTKHFVPPFNSMSERALPDAAWFEGIRVIWGRESTWPVPPQPHPIGRVLFVPAWKPTYGATLWKQGPEDSRLIDAPIQYTEERGVAVMTLHLTWEAAKDPKFEGVKSLAGMLASLDMIVSPDDFVSEFLK